MSFRYISFLCYNTFRYIKFLFLLYWADDFLLYQFPFYCYIRIRYITFRYINFLFLVISDSVTSNSVISISVFWLYQFPLYQSPLYQFPFFVTSDSVISVSWKNVTSHSVISNSVISTSPSPFTLFMVSPSPQCGRHLWPQKRERARKGKRVRDVDVTLRVSARGGSVNGPIAFSTKGGRKDG